MEESGKNAIELHSTNTSFTLTSAYGNLELGTSDVRIISAKAIAVEDRFALMCEPPQCPNYGQSMNCPPHAMKPGEFRILLQHYSHALVFKIDVPTQILLTDERRDVARQIHELAAAIETFARNSGYCNAKGIAAGSCKPLFCDNYVKCRALEESGTCRFPDLARPSMSGLGINFFELSRKLNWQIEKITRDSDPDTVPQGMMAGIVLLS